MPSNLVLRLRALDHHGSDQAMWELRRETLGYVWWYWPTLSGDDGWERVRGFQPARTAALAEEEARKWFCVNFAGLRVEITAGYQDTGARLAMGARS